MKTPLNQNASKHLDTLVHYTVNTGHTNDSPRADVSEDTIKYLAGIGLEGFKVVPGPKPLSLWITRASGCALFTIYCEGIPLVHCGLAWTKKGDQEMWPGISEVYDLVYKYLPGHNKEALQPSRFPWLSVVLLPSLGLVGEEIIGMLGDLERCIAWTIMEEEQKRVEPFMARVLGQAGTDTQVVPANGQTFTLSELQQIVGGNIEILHPPGQRDLILVVNEWGKAIPGLQKNDLASRLWQEGCEPGSPRSQDDIVGDVLLCHTNQVN